MNTGIETLIFNINKNSILNIKTEKKIIQNLHFPKN